MIRKAACSWGMLVIFVLLSCTPCIGKGTLDTLVLNRMFSYRTLVDTTIEGHRTTAYMKFRVKSKRRNLMLLCVPHLYPAVRHGNKSHVGESVATLTFHEGEPLETELHLRSTTVRRSRSVMPNLNAYLTPSIYSNTLMYDHLYSPFHPHNKRYYRYTVQSVFGSNAQVDFRPRLSNTQAVRGHAIIDVETGRVIRCTLIGEYDMVSFEIDVTMGDTGLSSLLPTHCVLKAKFSFLGNQVRGIYEATYDIPPPPPGPELRGLEARALLDSLRPQPLTPDETAIYAEYDSLRREHTADTTNVEDTNFWKDFLWEVVGENLLRRIKGHFGNDHGYYRISPIINPLYLSYSHRKGMTYRMTARLGYSFNENSSLSTRLKAGYSFKLNHPYFDLPVTYTFDERNQGYIRYYWRHGELQTTSTVLDHLKDRYGETFDWDTLNLDYFKHSRMAITAHYELNKYIGIECGLVFNRWKSVQAEDFKATGIPTIYKSCAFSNELTIRPLGWHGPIVTIDYERTFDGATEDKMDYEKWEFDCSYLRPLPCLRSLSLRGGLGFYTKGTRHTYFLDFNNFREDNIPGGWGDEWSGDFELLHSNWYNSSNYYIRANATYESPMLLLSWVPFVGKIMEKERVYVGALRLSQIKNYVELGYSFTNRLLSMGWFTSFEEGHYHSMGLRFGLELFDKW